MGGEGATATILPELSATVAGVSIELVLAQSG